MKVLTTREIQAESLKILQTVHGFCEENGLVYSLAFGSLIGAIRHKGFIPWDDDIDIIMPRPDYERFVTTFSAPGLGIASEKDKDYYLNYCRVFDTVKTGCHTILPIGKNYKGGVWIDVFPADGVADDFKAFSENIRPHKHLWTLQLRYRYSLTSWKEILHAGSVKDKCILLALKISGRGQKLLDRVNAELRQNAVRIPFGSTGHWSQLGVLDDGIRNYQLCSDFETTLEAEFEGHSFRIMNGYDRFLRNIYGDYMKLPPEDQRVPKHGHATLYWK